MLTSSYQIIEQIYESANSLVYRARRKDDNVPVILKILKGEYPSPERIAWFKREYEATRALNTSIALARQKNSKQSLSGVVNVYDLKHIQQQWVMVLEDFGGDSLALLGLAGQLDVIEFLKLAIDITRIVSQIHQHQIIHKDINPTNIVLNPKTKQIKIIDFGISTGLLQEDSRFRHPNVLEGTLAYISPEQTGRINRAVDYRTDFYALGVTFYELLSGQLPFESADPLELVHSHIAKQAPALVEINPAIPPILSDIVLKLMAKNSQDRYQSAYGLVYDLEQALGYQLSVSPNTEHSSKREGDWGDTPQAPRPTGSLSFELGRQDISDRFQIPQKLYGREQETARLLAAFDRITDAEIGQNKQDDASQSKIQNPKSKIELVLVAGQAGIGKSALVKETHQAITQKRGYFIEGKFEQLQRHIPYFAFGQAFSGLIRHLLTESEAEIAAWREKLLAALKSNGQIIIDFIPEVELIIGPQPVAPEVGPTEAQNRFHLVFQNFVEVFAQAQHPLVIFIDDLQWADSGSLKLLESLLTALNISHFAVIGAYRDNEVDGATPLHLTLKTLTEAGLGITQISLSPLSQADISCLLGDMLHRPLKQVDSLAGLIFNKTGGNPFFTLEFIKTLYADGLLDFDYARGCWQWDTAQIENRAITDNVAALMVDKVKRLPPNTQNVVRLASCIGNRFDLQTLAIVYRKSRQATAADLEPALIEGLVIPLNDSYKVAGVLEDTDPPLPEQKLTGQRVKGTSLAHDKNQLTIEYKFAHDRIRQAAYSLIDVQEKQPLHYQIGSLWLANLAGQELTRHIFEIVKHLNQGAGLIKADPERLRLAKMNLDAGQMAKDSAAYQSAFEYAEFGLGLLTEADWGQEYALSLQLYTLTAQLAGLTGNFELGERLIERALPKTTSLLDETALREVQIINAGLQHKHQQAVEITLAVLAQHGITIPRQPTALDLQREIETVNHLLGDRKVADLINLPDMTDPYKLMVMRLLTQVNIPAFFYARQQYPFFLLEAVKLSIQHGNAEASADAYVSWAYVLYAILDDIETGRQFGELALRLVHSKTPEFKARTYYEFYNHIGHRHDHIRNSLAPLLEAYQSGLETGDFAYAVINRLTYVRHRFFTGDPLTEVAEDAARCSGFIHQVAKDGSHHYYSRIFQQTALNLLGKSADPAILTGEAFQEDEMEKLDEIDDASFANLNKLMLYYTFGEYTLAVEIGNPLTDVIGGLEALVFMTTFYLYDSLARLAIWTDVSKPEQQYFLDRVTQNQQHLEKWAAAAPMNYQHKFYLVEAELARVLGNDGQAREYYDQAITLARQNKYINEEALANEVAARFYLAKEYPRIAHFYLREAHYAYQQWGAAAKVEDLESRYPHLFASVETAAWPGTTTPTLGSRQSVSGSLDLITILKASQAISGEIVLDKLLVNLMEIAIENAGADRGVLILVDPDGQWRIEAERAVDDPRVTVLQSIPVTDVENLPQSIINYVAHVREPLVLDNAVKSKRFRKDPYILAGQPKSLLCLPLLNRGRLSGMLYLENSLSPGVFTAQRLETLNLLSSQAAISIENAALYNTLEQKVEERTLELAEKNEALREAKEAALEAQHAAETANRAKSAFLANMSHELRTPLNAIIGFAQIIARSKTLPPKQQQNLGIINRSGEHLLSLINQVLELSKIEAGRMTLNKTVFDLHQMLTELEGMFRLRADDKQLRLIFERSPDVPRTIRTDEVKLRQVLINLLNNALKFTEEGNVTLQVGSRQYEVGSREENTPLLPTSYCLLCFEISDTGPGIAPEEIPSLFEAFSQTETGQHAQEGTGLGLPISHKFVQLLGGNDIKVTSPKKKSEIQNRKSKIEMGGPGATFAFDIRVEVVDTAKIAGGPYAGELISEIDVQVVGLAPNQPRYRILIVDDEPTNRQLLHELLAPLGFDLRQAENGRQAIEIWQEFHPHLIWMDMQMPTMDGYEATKIIKSKQSKIQNLPSNEVKGLKSKIVALTARSFEEERAKILASGCDDMVSKPFRQAELFQMMSRHLGVQFVYETPDDLPATIDQAENTLTPEMIALLPPNHLTHLTEAIELSDIAWANQIIDDIRPSQPELAETLSRLINDFEYDTILAALEQVTSSK